MHQQPLHVRSLGATDYHATWLAMQQFTQQRDAETLDEVWLTEHAPVYTLGLNRRQVRLPERQDIPLVLVDRGGKITYHGPGQLVVYLLLDLKRLGISIRELVTAMELAMVDLLAHYGIPAQARDDAPGVYVGGHKIASLGLRMKQQCCYHGLALNLAMDLAPFHAIDPCGYQGLQVTDLRSQGCDAGSAEVSAMLLKNLVYRLHYQPVHAETEIA